MQMCSVHLPCHSWECCDLFKEEVCTEAHFTCVEGGGRRGREGGEMEAKRKKQKGKRPAGRGPGTQFSWCSPSNPLSPSKEDQTVQATISNFHQLFLFWNSSIPLQGGADGLTRQSNGNKRKRW